MPWYRCGKPWIIIWFYVYGPAIVTKRPDDREQGVKVEKIKF